MRVLITGSSGQIGTNLALRLIDEGHRVLRRGQAHQHLDRPLPLPTTGPLQPLPAVRRGIGGVEYPQVDVVVHLAAHAKVHELVRHPHRAMENITMTYNVLEYCRLARLPIVFSSSREVYGDIHRYIEDETNRPRRWARAQPTSPTPSRPTRPPRLPGEALIYSYARCYGLKYIVFRFSNVYGRYDNDIERMERVIPLFITPHRQRRAHHRLRREESARFHLRGRLRGGYRLGIKPCTRAGCENQTINLAYGEGNTLVKMAQYAGDALHKEPKITIAPTLLGEVTHYVADISKARELLRLQPQGAARRRNTTHSRVAHRMGQTARHNPLVDTDSSLTAFWASRVSARKYLDATWRPIGRHRYRRS